jgi:hypothetical protein
VSARRRVSQAAQELSDRLRAQGVDVSPREIERWHQEHGLIEPTIRRWIPRCGSKSAYPPQAEIQAKQVRALLDEGLDLADIVVVQWLRRNYVETGHLKRVLILKIRERFGPPETFASWMDAKPRADAQARRAAVALARTKDLERVRRAMFEAGRTGGERINRTVTRLLSSMFLIAYTGEAYTRQELEQLLAAMGTPDPSRDADWVAEQLRRMQPWNLEDLVENATREQLDQAVAENKLLLQFASALGVDFKSNVEHERVLQVVGMLPLRNALGSDLDTVLSKIRSWLPPDSG